MAAPQPDEATSPLPVAEEATPRTWRNKAIRVLVWTLIALFAWYALNRIIGSVDWVAVGAAFRSLDPLATVIPLFALLLVRQTLNAVPLVYYVPGLSWMRSVRNDLAANVIATVAPPPGDIVLRVAMFRSWGLDAIRGMTGVTLNSFKFYAVRFLVPSLGLILLAGTELAHRQWVLALLCLVGAVAILGSLVLMLRSDDLAAKIGRWAGSVVAWFARLFRRSIDVSAFPERTVELRHQASDSLRRGLFPSMLALVGMVVVDGSILAVALRGVGVGPGDLPLVEILGWVLLTYPLTTLPLFGLGVLDAIIVGAWTLTAGVEFEGSIVAATIVWRIVTILGTLILGALVVIDWKLREARGARERAESPLPATTPEE